jgi:hypothetical protein
LVPVSCDTTMHGLSPLLVALATPLSAFAWTTYIVPHAPGSDDTPALLTALNSGNLSVNATILFQKGTTYNIFSPITFPKFTNVEVAIEGNLTYPDDIATVQAKVAASGTQLSHLSR